MADELIPDPDEEASAEQEQEEEQGFLSGFDAGAQSPGEGESGEKPAEGEEGEPAEDAETPEGEPAPPPTDAEVLALSPDQIRMLLAKSQELDELKGSTDARLRQAFGKIGEVGGIVRQLQQSRQHKLVLPEGGLKNLAAEFPAVAEYLQSDLQEVFNSVGTITVAPDADAIDELLKPRFEDNLGEVEKLVERRLLKRAHPDWQTIVAAPSFEEWRKTLPPETAAELMSSFDADFLSDKITEHKTWLKARADTAKQKQDRLRLAVAPAGGRPAQPARGTVQDEEAGFLAAFQQKR